MEELTFVVAVSVVIVSMVSILSATRAGVASRLSQKDSHEMITIKIEGK